MVDQPKRILLADEHADTLHVTALVLRKAGYQVSTARTVAEAMQLCDRENFDLLLGDLGFPDGSGLDLMRLVAKRCNIKGIAYTGWGYESDVANAKEAGFSAHLLKPVDQKRLLETVERVLQGVTV